MKQKLKKLNKIKDKKQKISTSNQKYQFIPSMPCEKKIIFRCALRARLKF